MRILKKVILDEGDAPAMACSIHQHISECGLKSWQVLILARFTRFYFRTLKSIDSHLTCSERVYDFTFWSVRPILLSTSKSSNLYLHLIFTSQIFLVFLLSHAFYICVKSPSFLLSYLAVVRVVGNPIWTRNSPTGYKFRLLPLQ